MPDALCNFPAISDTIIREARKNIDDGFRGIVRAYGTVIDAVVQPLQWFLNDLEWLFTNTPWIIVLLVMMGVVYFASRNIRIVIGTAISMILIGVFGLWNDTMITLAELLVTMSLLAIVLGIALPQFPRRPYALWTAHEQLLADLRLARADALTRGDHFRFDIYGATTYREYRMRLVAGVWVINGPPLRDRTLPAGVSFTSGVGSQFEFNTRGLMLNPGAATQITLSEAATGHTRVVTVWPSGQVMPL